MKKIASFIKAVREAQGISQESVAKGVGITQSVISRYENADGSLAQETLKRIAALLNLNPELIDNSTSYPFKLSDGNDVIKMILPDNDEGEVNPRLLDALAIGEKSIEFLLLKLIEIPQRNLRKITRLVRKGYSICAIEAKDSNDNIFLFRRKKEDSFFHERGMTKKLHALSPFFTVRTVKISTPLYEKIQKWSDVTFQEIPSLFHGAQHGETMEFLTSLINAIWAQPMVSSGEVELKGIRKALEQLDLKTFEQRVPSMKEDIINVIKRYVGINDSRKHVRL